MTIFIFFKGPLMDILKQLNKIKHASIVTCLFDTETKKAVLKTLASLIRHESERVIKENQKDLDGMDPSNPMFDRLLLNHQRLTTMANDIDNIANLSDPIDITLQKKMMNNGLMIEKVTVPLGVVAVIYEARPNVTTDVFSLCFKSGNACVLKGGKEAAYSNLILVDMIKRALIFHDLNPDLVLLLLLDRKETELLLTANDCIDVCIPRGSKSLIDFVRQTATIPVIETGAGVVHLYVDVDADSEKARNIIHNAKTRRVSVCNALDCLLIHAGRLSDLPFITEPLRNHVVTLFVDVDAYHALKEYYPLELLQLDEKGTMYGTEFLGYTMSIKTVHSVKEAIDHIAMYSSHHSDGIITQHESTATLFTRSVDSAVVYVNASTAFTDGSEFGLGGEIGISTQKLHARGPMGLEALTSYKWIVRGDGQVR